MTKKQRNAILYGGKGIGRQDKSSDCELLVGLSVEELEASAASLLAPAAQAPLDELLAGQKALSAAEARELHGLLEKVDHLAILKTRARDTLNQQRTVAVRP